MKWPVINKPAKKKVLTSFWWDEIIEKIERRRGLRGDLDASDAFHDEFGGSDGFGATYVGLPDDAVYKLARKCSQTLRIICTIGIFTNSALPLHIPEQELPIQIADIDGVHIDYMNVAKTRQGQILEDLATQTAGAYDEDLAAVEKVLCLQVNKEYQ